MKIDEEGKRASRNNIKNSTEAGKEGKKQVKNAKEIKLQRK